jgi:hypothetical protein
LHETRRESAARSLHCRAMLPGRHRVEADATPVHHGYAASSETQGENTAEMPISCQSVHIVIECGMFVKRALVDSQAGQMLDPTNSLIWVESERKGALPAFLTTTRWNLVHDQSARDVG